MSAEQGDKRARRYLTIIQDARGYPAPGGPLDKAPPEGPEQPQIVSVVRADDYEAACELPVQMVESLREHAKQVKREDYHAAIQWQAAADLLELRFLRDG